MRLWIGCLRDNFRAVGALWPTAWRDNLSCAALCFVRFAIQRMPKLDLVQKPDQCRMAVACSDQSVGVFLSVCVYSSLTLRAECATRHRYTDTHKTPPAQGQANQVEGESVPLKRPNLVPQSSFKFPSVQKYCIVSWAERTLSHEGP